MHSVSHKRVAQPWLMYCTILAKFQFMNERCSVPVEHGLCELRSWITSSGLYKKSKSYDQISFNLHISNEMFNGPCVHLGQHESFVDCKQLFECLPATALCRLRAHIKRMNQLESAMCMPRSWPDLTWAWPTRLPTVEDTERPRLARWSNTH
jgi:hypothetical protein